MERIKIINNMLDNCINLLGLKSTGRFKDYSALHDNWLLHGESQEELFENIIPQYLRYSTDVLPL
jgi:hypothetical protein